MNYQILRKIEAFSENYKSLLSSETLAFKEAGSWDRIRQDWWFALLFFFDRAFYQGRSDILSGRFERATVEALAGSLIDSTSDGKLSSLIQYQHWLQRERWKDPDNPLWSALCQTYEIGERKRSGTGRERDREMVLDTLQFIVNNCEGYNILEYSVQSIKNGNIEELSKKLHNIISIGDKIASFYLRDTVFVYELDNYLKPEDYHYVMPIDTWVRQISNKIGIEADAKAMATACQQNGVSPIKFNQGAWYIGSHSLSVLLDTWI